jgi:hypothetical protein
MAISRPFLLLVLGTILLGATVFAVQNSRTAVDGDAVPAAVQSEPAPAAPAAKDTSTPQETLKQAFDLGQLDSAKFAARASFRSSSDSVTFALSGAFQTGAVNDIPEFDVDVRISVAGQKVDGGFVSLGDKAAYFTKGDTGWRVPEAVWAPFTDAAAAGGAQSQPLPFEVHPETWVRDVKSEGTDEVAGVETDHVSATVDPRAVVKDIARAAGQNGTALPGGDAATDSIKRAEFDVWVGSDDHLLRRASAEIVSAGGAITFDLRLSDVNKAQQIEAPADVRQGLPGGTLGELASGIVSGIASVSGAEPVSIEALTSRKPQRAARAVRAHKKVVILFRNPQGLDDRAMAPVMRDVARRTGALVLTDHVDAVERYGKLVEDVGVSQTPSVVIIDRSGEARLIEGYLDSDTLTQAVADTR